MKHFFPAVLIGLDIIAAVVYAYYGDRGRGVYWICAAGITYSATFLVK